MMDAAKNTKVQAAVHHREEVQQGVSCGVQCPYCGRSVAADDEICPHCGARLTADCSFCGNRLFPGERECPECGMPAGGVRCPNCGSLNHRSFCRVCNTPLTRAAVRAVREAQEDPAFQQCKAMAEKLAELEESIFSVPPAQAEELKIEQKKILCRMNDMLKSMLPPPGSTPKEQVIFYSARKVAVKESVITRQRVGWVCNYCGCTHNQPSECTKPQLGGHWIYEQKEQSFITYK